MLPKGFSKWELLITTLLSERIDVFLNKYTSSSGIVFVKKQGETDKVIRTRMGCTFIA